MEYQIDVEDGKTLEVKSFGEDLSLIFIHKDGEICLSSRMYKVLKQHSDALSQALLKVCAKEDNVHCNVDLGRNIHAYVNSPYRCVQIRQFEEIDENKNIATKEGISFKRAQWFVLLGTFNQVEKDFASPKRSIQCGEFHANQEDYFACPMCCPSAGLTDAPQKKQKYFNVKQKALDEVRTQLFEQ